MVSHQFLTLAFRLCQNHLDKCLLEISNHDAESHLPTKTMSRQGRQLIQQASNLLSGRSCDELSTRQGNDRTAVQDQITPKPQRRLSQPPKSPLPESLPLEKEISRSLSLAEDLHTQLSSSPWNIQISDDDIQSKESSSEKTASIHR